MWKTPITLRSAINFIASLIAIAALGLLVSSVAAAVFMIGYDVAMGLNFYMRPMVQIAWGTAMMSAVVMAGFAFVAKLAE